MKEIKVKYKYFILLLTVFFVSCPSALIVDSVWSGTGESTFNKVTIEDWKFYSDNTTELTFKYSNDSISADWFSTIDFSGDYTMSDDNKLTTTLHATLKETTDTGGFVVEEFELEIDGELLFTINEGQGEYSINVYQKSFDSSGDQTGSMSGPVDSGIWNISKE